METILGILANKKFWWLVVPVIFAVYLAFKIRQFDREEPFSEAGGDIPDPLPEDFQVSEEIPTPQEMQAEPPAAAPQPIPGEEPVRSTGPSSIAPGAGSDITKLSAQIEMLIRQSSQPSAKAIPDDVRQMIQSIPAQIEQLKGNIALGKSSGGAPPAESPILKEIAASVVNLQKQVASLSANPAAPGEGGGAGLSPETITKIEALGKPIQKILDYLTSIGQRFESMTDKISRMSDTVQKIAETPPSSGGGLSPEAIATLKTLQPSLESLKSQLESHPLPEGGGQDFKPVFDLVAKKMEDFQYMIMDMQKSMSGKKGDKGGEDLSELQEVVGDLKSTIESSSEAEETLFSRLGSKLDIIHQVISSLTISGSSALRGAASAGSDTAGVENVGNVPIGGGINTYNEISPENITPAPAEAPEPAADGAHSAVDVDVAPTPAVEPAPASTPAPAPAPDAETPTPVSKPPVTQQESEDKDIF